ncbi:sel1 repeat family protein [Acidobacteria bacterium AH-259-D05]|nr:sel1 repeat family protein [Acidobacteria bacterium AH-259-D05]
MPARMFLALILVMQVLPAFAQDQIPSTAQSTTKDDAEEIDLSSWRRRAEQGSARAQYILGYMYRHGEGVPQDYKEAFRWAQAAAEQGNERGQLLLAVMYHSGEGVPQDYIQAHMWYNLAASNLTGDDAKIAAKGRDDLAKGMTPEQIAEAQRLAREWSPTTATILHF